MSRDGEEIIGKSSPNHPLDLDHPKQDGRPFKSTGRKNNPSPSSMMENMEEEFNWKEEVKQLGFLHAIPWVLNHY